MNLNNDFDGCVDDNCGSNYGMHHMNECIEIQSPLDKWLRLEEKHNCSDECPICMDDIDVNKNRLVTECGHIFHTSCLMKNAAVNGFGCPLCRAVMVEEEPDDDDDISESTDSDELYTDYSLSGMRWMFQTVQGEELDDDYEESDEEEEDNELIVPSIEYVMDHMQLHNISMEKLMKCILSANYDGFTSFEPDSDAIFNLLDTLIIGYEPPDATSDAVTTPIAATIELPVPSSIKTDYIFPYDETFDNSVDNKPDTFADSMIFMPTLPTPPSLYPIILPYNPSVDDNLEPFYKMVREVNLKQEQQCKQEQQGKQCEDNPICITYNKLVSDQAYTGRIGCSIILSRNARFTTTPKPSLIICDNSLNHVQAVDSWFI